MKSFTHEDLEFLATDRAGWCITMLMPTHRAGRDTQQDPITLKNLLGEAEAALVSAGVRAPTARTLLEPAQRLLEEGLFWRHQADGLALFLAADVFRYYRVPIRLDPLAIVGPRFHLKPLLRLFTGNGRFFVLALSQNAVRVLEGTRYGIDALEPDDLPHSLAEALPFEDPERQLQFHTGAPQAGGQRAAIFHGHGAGAEVEKDRLLRYFRAIDAGLRDLLRDERAPLVLAAVDYLHSIYREASTYTHLVTGQVLGNPEALTPEELQRRAWTAVEPRFLEALQDAAAAYRRLAGTGRTSTDVAETVRAAREGRVATLFVAAAEVWGTVDPATGQVRVSPQRAPGDEDLVDHAAIQSLLKRGTVFALESAEMPVDAPLAAVFRY